MSALLSDAPELISLLDELQASLGEVRPPLVIGSVTAATPCLLPTPAMTAAGEVPQHPNHCMLSLASYLQASVLATVRSAALALPWELVRPDLPQSTLWHAIHSPCKPNPTGQPPIPKLFA